MKHSVCQGKNTALHLDMQGVSTHTLRCTHPYLQCEHARPDPEVSMPPACLRVGWQWTVSYFLSKALKHLLQREKGLADITHL